MIRKIYFIIIFICLIVTAFAQNSRIVKGPWLIYPGNNTQMTVIWQLDTTYSCQLRWGLTTDYNEDSIITIENSASDYEHIHQHTITGLTPGQLYYYSIFENDVYHNGSFNAAPDDIALDVSFYAYGDTRSQPYNTDSVSSQINNDISIFPNDQTLIVHSGDWNTSDSETYWQNEFFNDSYPDNLILHASIPVMGCRGNHEGGATQFAKYFPYNYNGYGYYYYYYYGPVHFIIVDQYISYSYASPQYLWIDSVLANSTKQWKVVVFHEPGYTDENYHTNNATVQTQLQPLLVNHNVAMTISGHNHNYAHCLVENVHHMTFGGGGAPLYPILGESEGFVNGEASLHFGKVKANQDSMYVSVIRPDGSIIENFTIKSTSVRKNTVLANNLNVSIFPSNGNLRIIAEKESKDSLILEVFSLAGKKIYSAEYSHNEARIETEIELSKKDGSIFIVRIISGEDSYTKKVIVP